MSDETERANERGRKVLHGLMTADEANAEAAAEVATEPVKKTTKKPAPEA